MKKKKSKNKIKIFEIIIILGLMSLYVGAAFYHAFFVNINMEKTDQSAYIDYAKMMKMTDYEYIGDRNRMPVYPFLLSLLYNSNLNREDYFQRGKLLNISLSIVLLFLIYIILRNYFSKYDSQILVLIIAFTIFIYRAPYVQCELLFYFLYFCVFLLLLRLIQKPTLWIGAISGIIVAVAQLTKASIIPAVICFTVFYTLRNIIGPLAKNSRSKTNIYDFQKYDSILKSSLIVIVFLFVFIITMFPYISNSKRVFGHYFYNVNSTFYIWNDSWAEVVKGTRAHGDRIGWPQMPQEEIPSFRKYVSEHSFLQFLNRLGTGLILVPGSALLSYGYLKYFFIYLIAGIFVTASNRELTAFIKRNNNYITFLYLASVFFGYYFLYAFFSPICNGPRLAMSQFIPAMFCLFYILARYDFNYYMKSFNIYINTKVLHIFVLILMILDIIFYMSIRIQYYAGD